MTTNHRENLDHALIRPGRADLSFQYFNASRKQAEAYFKVFYSHDKDLELSHGNVKPSVDEKHDGTSATLESLAQRWASAIPEREFSSASLQGEV